MTLERDAWIVGGIVFVLCMSGVFAGSDAPSQTTSDPAPLHTYLVPHAALADLQQDSAAIEVQMSLARQLENQLNEATSARADRKARQHQLDLLIEQIDQGRRLHDGTLSVSKNDIDEHSGSYRPQSF